MPSREEAEDLLRNVGCSGEVVDHSRVVADLAIEIARRLTSKGMKVNLNLVEAGALLHDIGRSKTHSVLHGSCGGSIAQTLGLPVPLIRIIERHVGAGIPVGEATVVGLPNRDFIPETLEEKIVAYADKLVIRNRVISFRESLEDFSRKLGCKHPAIERLEKLHTEISSLMACEF